MVHREVRRELLRKLNITPQALSLRAQKIKATLGPMTTEEAVYLIAHQNGIDFSRILPISIVDRVRSLIPRDLPKPSPPSFRRIARKNHAKTGTASYPLVSPSLLTQSVSIGNESFPQVFVLENSIRNLISRELSKAHGREWWDKAVSTGIRESVQRIIDKEKKYPHRERRGYHPIFYSSLAHLKEIILRNRQVFSKIILDFMWFEVQMDQVYMARNSLAHSILISKDDRDRIRLFYRDWSRLLETAGY
jgi:hypothetical protein